jgi:acetyltransferase-like isoleucine patch superfamily enzyme
MLVNDRGNGGSRLAASLRRLRRLPAWLLYRKGPPIASELRKRWVLFRNPHADIRFEGPVYLGPGFSLHMPKGGSFIVGPNVEFRRNFRAELMGPESRIEIGAESVFTYSVLIQCGTSIEIGERVMFGQSAMVVDGNHRYRDLDTPMLDQGFDFRPITIEDDVTTTTKCTIVNSIGRRAFVGANAVVTKPIPPYSVAVGVPARVVDYFGPPGEETPELVASQADKKAGASRWAK